MKGEMPLFSGNDGASSRLPEQAEPQEPPMELHTAHFQLTGRCNLACSFCGQRRGAVAAGTAELSRHDWLHAAGQLLEAARRAGRQPVITLWGGEPLLYGDFAELAGELYRLGCELEVITNGTLIDRHAELLCRCFERIFVSLDGGREDHDAGRGAGVFDRVAANLRLLKRRRGKLIFLTTCTDRSVRHMAELPEILARLEPDEIMLQQLLYLSREEIAEYRRFSRLAFGRDYPEIAAWERDDDREYLANWRRGRRETALRHYPVPVRVAPLLYPEAASAPCCTAPWHRVHIRHDGEVGFCTDYFGFSAGNIRHRTLVDILAGEAAKRFRRAVREQRLPCCRHCPWRLHAFSPCPAEEEPTAAVP